MIYLASASPRRYELLTAAGYEVEVIKSSYDEDNIVITTPYDMVMEQARGKALHTPEKYRQQNVVIGADTIVVLNNKILGKPLDIAEAKIMLKSLVGNTHEVVTGVCILKDNIVDNFYISTQITFNELDDSVIDNYLATHEVLDKAGAYGLQDLDEKWIAKTDGYRSNVIGLPVEEICRRLKIFSWE